MDKNENLFRRAGSFSMAERETIVKEYLSGAISKSDLWFKYTGSYKEHGNINRWLTQLGLQPQYCKYDSRREKSANFELPNSSTLPKEESTGSEGSTNPSIEELQKKLTALKAELETEKLRTEGYQLMIEIAERQFNIPIVKKSDTKR